MDILIKTTNRKLYGIPTDIALALIEGQPSIYGKVADSGAVTDPRVEPPPKHPLFSAGTMRSGACAVICSMPSGEKYYFQPREREDAQVVWRNEKLTCPEHIFQQYRNMKRKEEGK